MAYERQTEKILAGSWNVLPPGDLIPKEDALLLDNWRVTSAGSLRTRWGHTAPLYQFFDLVLSIARLGPERYFSTNGGNLYRSTALVSAGFSPNWPLALTSMQGWLWALSPDLSGKTNLSIGTSLYRWVPLPPGAPVLTPLPGGALVDGQTYTWWITYTTDDGHESNPSSASATIAQPNQNMQIDSPAASGDPQVTGWNLYRSGNTLGTGFRINRTPIAIGANIVDSGDPLDLLGDSDLARLGIAIEVDHDDPPPAKGLGGPYYEKLLAWNTPSNPNRLFWSKTQKPYAFPGAALDEGNHVDVGREDEGIVAVSFRPRHIIVYKEASTWRLVGDPDELASDLEELAKTEGIIGPSIAQAGSLDFVQRKDGIYQFRDSYQKISGRLDPLFRGERPDEFGSNVFPLDADLALRRRNVLYHRNGQVGFAYCEDGFSTSPTRMMVYDIASQRWAGDSRAFNAFLNEGDDAELLGAQGVDIVALESPGAFGDGNGTFDAEYHSRYHDQDHPGNDKVYADLVVEANTSGATCTVKAFFNSNSLPEETLGTINTTVKDEVTFQFGADKLGSTARNIAIRLEVTSPSAGPVTIYKLTLHYYVKARPSKTFDSGETNLGTEKVKEIDALEFDAEIPPSQAIDWKVYTDLPGNALALRSSASLNEDATATRRPWRIPIQPPIEGRLARIALRADSTEFGLYACRARIRPIGVYVEQYEAAAGQLWDSYKLDFDTNEVKQGRQIELDCDTDGQITVSISTDLPGNEITVRASHSVDTSGAVPPGGGAASHARRKFFAQIPAGTEGRLWQVKVFGTKAFRLYGARLEVKVVGTYIELYQSSDGAIWDSDFSNLGTDKVKELDEAYFEVDTDGDVALTVYTDLPGQNVVSRKVKILNTGLTTAGRRIITAQLAGIDGRLARFVLSGASAYRLYAASVTFRVVGTYVEADQAAGGHIWTSTPLDFGLPNVKEVRRVEVNTDTFGAVAADLLTDLPGNALASRANTSIPDTAGRRPFSWPLAAAVEGRQIELRLTSQGGYKLYGARAEIRSIGTYIEGYEFTAGFVWDTRALDLSTEALKLYKELELVGDSTGVTTVEVWTDRPAGTLALRQTITVSATSGEESRKLRLDADTLGRKLRIRIKSTSGLNLFHLRVYYRILGSASAWTWAELPVDPTGDAWQWVDFPVEPTLPTLHRAELPVAKTPPGWRWVDLPVEPTPAQPYWVDIPVSL